MWVSFMKKHNFEQVAEKKKCVFWKKNKKTCPDQIQNDDQNIDGIDRFHQQIQSLHDPKPLSGSSFHSVLLGSFDL